MRYEIPLLIAAGVGLAIWGSSYVRFAGVVEWPRARFLRATLIAFGFALWPLLLVVFPVAANVLPWILFAMVLGGATGFLTGNNMPISLRENSTLVRIRSTSPIMELIVITAVADVFARGSGIEESLLFAGLAFSSTALAGVYGALNRNLQDPGAFATSDAEGDFCVVLRRIGTNKSVVVKTLRRETDLAFGETFPTIRLPKTVLDRVNEQRAASLRDQLEALGASAEVTQAHT